MHADALHAVIDNLHLIVPGLLALWFLSTLLSTEDEGPALRTGPCPRCRGSGQVEKRDPLSGFKMPMGCPACRGIGQVRDYQTFTRDVYRECEACEATGFQTVVSGPHFPDGSPAPGAQIQTVPCTVCEGGWLEMKDQVTARRIVPFSHPPPATHLQVVPAAELEFDDDDDDDDEAFLLLDDPKDPDASA